MASIKKWLKLTVLNFWEKFKFSQYGVNGAFLSPKSALLKFSQNLFIRCFWNYTWWQTLKMSKRSCLNFEENLHFCIKNAKTQKFHEICSLVSSKILYPDRHVNGTKVTVPSFLMKTLIIPKELFFGHFQVQNWHASYLGVWNELPDNGWAKE